MKGRIKKCLAMGVSVLMISTFLIPMTVHAVPINLTADISADGEEVNGGKELVYDADKNDTDSPYKVSYTGKLSMGTVWSNFNTLKTLYKLMLGATEEQWKAGRVTGDFKMSFTIDSDYVSVNPAFITKEAVQAQYELNNAGSDFVNYMRCYDASYDDTTGIFEALFRLETDGTTGILAGILDEASFRPANLIFSTPDDAFFVKASDFVAGESFIMTNPHVSGSIDMPSVNLPSVLPVTFNGTGMEAVELTMETSKTFGFKIVDNYGAPGSEDDDILVIFRKGDTGETAHPYLNNTTVMKADGTYERDGKYPSVYDLDIQLDDVRLTPEQISKIEWTVESAGGYPSFFGASIVEVTDGSKEIKALRAGIVKVTAVIDGYKDSIHIVVPGDTYRSGILDSTDTTTIERLALIGALATDDTFTPFTADMDGSFIVDSTDKTILTNMILGLISPSN